MDQLKIIECHGYTRDEAFKDLHFDPACAAIRGNNATQAWFKYGKPIPGTIDFRRFASQQLLEKTKCVPGLGLHLVLEQPIQDTRKRPYTLVNMIGKGTREWILKYQIREDDIVVDSIPYKSVDYNGSLIDGEEVPNINIAKIGPVIAECESKADAIIEAKRLTTLTHKNYSIIPIKVPDKTPISAFTLYTPASNTKEGIYIAFGIDRE